MKLFEEYGVEVHISDSSRPTAEQICDAEVVITRLKRIDADIIHAGRNLRGIIRHGVGVDNIDVKAATALSIPVYAVPGANTISVVEHIVTVVGLLAKQVLRYDTMIRDAGYPKARAQIIGRDLAGRTLGLIGLGRIGLEVAKRCQLAYDMKILAFDPFTRDVPNYVEKADEMALVFKRADFISLHIPLNDETRGIVGQSQLALMKKGAYLINTSRGEVVNEDALIKALTSGIISGAALDVFSEEPLPSDSPLIGFDNVILTPHVAGVTEDSVERLSVGAVNIALGILNGVTPEKPVNPEVFKGRICE